MDSKRLSATGIGDAARMQERTWSVMGQPDLDSLVAPLPSNGANWIVLLNFFDFERSGFVSHDDWKRGLQCIGMDALADDEPLWRGLLGLYQDPADGESIKLARIRYRVPFDPIVTTLLRSVVHTSGNMRGLLDASNQELHQWQEREKQRRAVLEQQNAFKIQRKVHTMKLRALRPVLSAWIDLRASEKLLARKSERFRSRLTFLRAWVSFQRHADDEAERKRRRAVLLRSRIGREWKRWVAIYHAKLDADEAAANLKLRMKRRGARVLYLRIDRAFGWWLEWRAQKRRLLKLGRRARMSRVADAFGRLSSSRKQQRKLRRVAARALQRHTRRAYEQWADVSAARMARNARLRKFIRGTRPEGRGWRAWRHFVVERNRKRMMMQRALSPALKGFLQWEGWWRTMRRLKRMAQRGLHRPAWRAFSQWREMAEGVVSRNARLLAHLHKTVHAPLANALATWRLSGASGRRMRKLAARWVDSGCSRCFNRWRFELLGKRQMKRLIRRMATLPYARVWRVWAPKAAYFTEERLRLRQGSKRLRLRQLRAVLDQWSDAYGRMNKMRRIAGRLGNRELARGWESWGIFAASRRRNVSTVRFVAGALMRRGWDVWVSRLWSGAQRRRLELFSLRMLNADIMRGWLAWCAANEERKEMLAKARRALAFLTHRTIWPCFKAWSEIILARKRERERQKRRAAARMAMRPAVRAFEAWAGHAAERRRVRLAFRARWSNSTELRVLRRWKDFLAAKRDGYRRFALRMQNGELARGFGTWAGVAEELRLAREEAEAQRAAEAAEAEEAARREAAAEEERRRREAEVEAARAGAAAAAARHAEAVSQLEAAAASALEAERRREQERQAERAALRKAQEEAAWRAAAAEEVETRRAAEAAEAARLLADARRELGEAADVAAAHAERLGEDRQLLREAARAAHEERERAAQREAEVEAARQAQGAAARQAAQLLNTAGTQLEAALSAAAERDGERKWMAATLSALEAQIDGVKALHHDLLPYGGRGGAKEMDEAVAERLEGVERKLEKLGKAIARTERLLAPMPLAALEAAAQQLMGRELSTLRANLEEQDQKVVALQRSKAYHHDLERARMELVRFLFSGAQQQQQQQHGGGGGAAARLDTDGRRVAGDAQPLTLGRFEGDPRLVAAPSSSVSPRRASSARVARPPYLGGGGSGGGDLAYQVVSHGDAGGFPPRAPPSERALESPAPWSSRASSARGGPRTSRPRSALVLTPEVGGGGAASPIDDGPPPERDSSPLLTQQPLPPETSEPPPPPKLLPEVEGAEAPPSAADATQHAVSPRSLVQPRPRPNTARNARARPITGAPPRPVPPYLRLDPNAAPSPRQQQQQQQQLEQQQLQQLQQQMQLQ